MSVAESWQRSHTAQFCGRWDPSAAVITAAGELDAANSDDLAGFVQHAVSRSTRVILDLRGVKFIGTAGFSSLHRINVICSAAQAQWTMVPSSAVSRLLRICDPDGTLPITTVAGEPLVKPAEGDEADPLLQLVPQSRQRLGEQPGHVHL